MKVLEFLDKHEIAWQPLNLKITDNGKTPKGYYVNDQYIIPKSNDAKEVYKERQQYLHLATHIGIDCRKVFQFDIDKPLDDMDEDLKEEMLEILENNPYYLSSTKKLPHVFIEKFRFEHKHKKLVDSYGNDFGDLQADWAYCPKDALMINGQFTINKIDVKKYIYPKKSLIKAKKVSSEKKALENEYEEIKKKFEKTHFKLMHPISFCEETTDWETNELKIIFRKRDDFSTTYSNLLLSNGKPFFKEWEKDPLMRTYSEIDFIPHEQGETINPNIYNLFTGFTVEPRDEEASIETILQHIRVLCGDSEDTEIDKSENYLLDWLACSVQNPKKLLPALVFISVQGVGKTTFAEWFGTKILGEKYYMGTGDSKHFFDRFATGLKNKLLICWEEAKGKDGYEHADMFKDLITNKKIMYEQKGKDAIRLNNSAKWWINSNNECPIKIEKSDRRFCVFNCSPKYAQNADYISKLIKAMDDELVQSSFYKFLMERDISKVNFENDRPKTQVYKDIQSYNKSSFEEWIEHLATTDLRKCEFGSTELYVMFKTFCSQINKTPCSFTKFGIEMNKKFEKKRTTKGAFYKIDFKKLKEEFGYLEEEESDSDSDSEIKSENGEEFEKL